MSALITAVQLTVTLLVCVVFFAIITPPILMLVYSQWLWSIPPFSWYSRWMDYWVDRSL